MRLGAILAACLVFACNDPQSTVRPLPSESGQDATDAIFDVSVIHEISLEMSAAAWKDISTHPRARRWHRARFQWRDEVIDPVGIKVFGEGSIRKGKPSLKISFDHVVRRQRWRGLEQLKLDNSAQDPSFMRERLGTEILRDFGVPASRTGWAKVVVNGRPVGFYVVLESVDDRFLKRWFGNDDGPLFGTARDAFGHGLNPMSDPLRYYHTETSVDSDGSELVRAARIVASGSDAEFAAKLDLPGFLRESIGRSAIGGIDSFSADANNFYLYVDHGQLKIISWDLDADFGARHFARALSLDPREPWAVSPWAEDTVTQDPYTEPVLIRQIAMGADIDALISELLDGPMRLSLLEGKIERTAALIRSSVAEDPLTGPMAFDAATENLRNFLRQRIKRLSGGS